MLEGVTEFHAVPTAHPPTAMKCGAQFPKNILLPSANTALKTTNAMPTDSAPTHSHELWSLISQETSYCPQLT